jgi:hypothetical protein
MTLLFHPSKKMSLSSTLGTPAIAKTSLELQAKGLPNLRTAPAQAKRFEWEKCGFVGRSILI